MSASEAIHTAEIIRSFLSSGIIEGFSYAEGLLIKVSLPSILLATRSLTLNDEEIPIDVSLKPLLLKFLLISFCLSLTEKPNEDDGCLDSF